MVSGEGGLLRPCLIGLFIVFVVLALLAIAPGAADLEAAFASIDLTRSHAEEKHGTELSADVRGRCQDGGVIATWFCKETDRTANIVQLDEAGNKHAVQICETGECGTEFEITVFKYSRKIQQVFNNLSNAGYSP